jgi:hypothetical protein
MWWRPGGRQAIAQSSSTAPRPHTIGTPVRSAKTSPGPWNAFADVDVFVDEVLAELTAMARDGIRPPQSGPKPALTGTALPRR